MAHENKKWLNKHMMAGMVYLILIFCGLIAGIYYWQYSSSTIINQIWHESNLNCQETVPIKARNKYSGEVKEFSNSCKFPRGWERISAASSKSESGLRTYKNDDYGFELKVPADFREINYQYNGKVDYVSVFLSDQSKANLFVNARGGQDLLLPESEPTETSFSTIAGKAVKIKRWSLADGRTLVRYIFSDKVSNWNTCKNVDAPDTTCNRIDLYASSAVLEEKLVQVVSSLNFYKPPTAATTSNLVYYHAADRLRVYDPKTGRETVSVLNGLQNYATIRKINNEKLVYMSNDQVAMYTLSTEQSETLFARNTENGITYVPDNFVISSDNSKIAIGYRYGTDRDLNACNVRCSGVGAGIIIVDAVTKLTKSAFDISIQATPVVWAGPNIILNNWSGGSYAAVSDEGVMDSHFTLPAELQNKVSTTNSQIIRTDATAAVDIRNQQDRFGSASYLFVNGKVVYKGGLSSINLVD